MGKLNKLKQEYSYLEAIKSLGLDGDVMGDEYKCSCPFHNESVPSFSINILTGKYNCFGCSAGGGFKQLVKELKGDDYEDISIISPPEILSKPESGFIIKKLKNSLKVSKSKYMKEDFLKLITSDEGNEAIDYLTKTRKIPTTMIELFKVKNGKGSMKGRAVFPVRDKKGKLLSAIGRSYVTDDQSKKVRNVPDTNVKGTLFGYHELLTWYKGNILILVEGPLDAISGQTKGYPTVALLSLSISSAQINLCSKHKVILYLDKVVDRAIQSKIVKQISEVTDVRILRPKKYKDLNEALQKANATGVHEELQDYKSLF